MTRTYRWASTVPLIGGMTLAAREVAGSDPEALITYKAFADNERSLRAYLPHTPYEVLDDSGSRSAGKDADFITALCPCAGLSQLGTGSTQARDAANSWMFETTQHVLGTLKPRVFWGENAPALYSASSAAGQQVRSKLEALAQQNGYTTSYYYTSTHLHGVPQKRHRTFYFFWRESDKVPVLPFWSKSTVGLADYLAQVPPASPNHANDVERAFKQLRATRFARWAQHSQGDTFPEVIRAELRERGKRQMMTVFDWVVGDPTGARLQQMAEHFQSVGDDRTVQYLARIVAKRAAGGGIWDDSPSIYLPDGNFNALIGRAMDSAHPVENRSLTTRECMHLMALPHDFELVTKNTNQICQNVPVCTAADMARGVIDYLEDRLPMLSARTAFQNNLKQEVETSRSEVTSKLLEF